MNEITNALYDLSVARETVNEDNARRIFTAVIRKLNSLVGAKVIRVYQKIPTEDGVLMQPFVWSPEVNPAPMRITFSDSPNGMLSWSYHNKKPLWIEGIRSEDEGKPIENKIDGEEISAQYRKFSYAPKSMIVVPLLSHGNDNLFGVFAIELDISGKFTQTLLDEITHTGYSFGRILDKLSIYERNISHANRTVETFLDRIRDLEYENQLLSDNIRTGLMIRPYDDEFDRVGSCVSSEFSKKGVLVEHYQPKNSDRVVIQELVDSIRKAHFCVADITGGNLNVFLEIGVAMSLEKSFILLQNISDESTPLFDISSYNVFQYEFVRRENKLEIWKAGNKTPVRFEDFLNEYIDDMERNNKGFENATPYECPPEEPEDDA